MKLALSISPCPNDTFMFDAMVNGRIDTEGLSFELRFADIEELNAGLLAGTPHISKSSYAVVPQIKGRYGVLSSGSALGRGNGPLLVTTAEKPLSDKSIVAIPGKHTTANMLLERLFPELTDKQEYLFSEIIPAVASGKCDAGVLIHEGRFVYRDHGLSLVADLGSLWEERTGLPLPLGAIAASRELPSDIVSKINRLLRRSIEYAFAHPDASREFVRSHAQELDDEVIRQHIELFVNEYSLNIGDHGRRAASELLGIPTEEIFL